MKNCSSCKEEKTLSSFCKNQNICRSCSQKCNRKSYAKNRKFYLSKMKLYQKKQLDAGLCVMGCGAPLHWSNKNYCIEHAAWRGKYYSHGLQLDGRLMLYARQNGSCAICMTEESDPMRLSVDHDHKTGNVRGLLCRTCNSGIGHFRDDCRILSNALKYVEERCL